MYSHLLGESSDGPDDKGRSNVTAAPSRRRAGRIVAALIVAGAGALLFGFLFSARNLGMASADLSLAVPTAPHLTPTGPDQRVYRIDASRSKATYSVTETIAGADRTAMGSTSGIAGDIAIDDAHPADSHLGDVVVNVQQLTSDQDLRDRRLRADFLESDRYPLITFHTTAISGLPTSVTDDVAYQVRVSGDLTVKTQTRPATLDATVTRHADSLHITGAITLKMSDYGIGPIDVVGFVKTGDDVRLDVDLAAVPAERGVPTMIAAAPTNSATEGASAPSFDRTIRPILESSCASCHAPGAVGSHQWTLRTAADARSAAGGLDLATSAQYMPPWPADDGGVAFQHDRRLSPDEIAQITAWSRAGGPLDIDPTTPVTASRDAAGPSIRPDITMTLPEPYQGSPDRPDDYRCFVLDPRVDHETYLTGFEFTPDRTEIVHHATLTRVTAAGRPDVDRVDAATAGSGWSCALGAPLTLTTDGPVAGTSGGGTSSQVSAWAPGQAAMLYPAGTGMKFEAGDFFLIQIHYHVAHPSPPDRSRFAVQTSTGTPLQEVRAATYFAPVEIPCATNQTGPACDRNNVLAQLGRDFGPAAPLLPVGINTACATNPDAFATMTAGTAHASCTQPATNPGVILWAMGHEHEIGASFKLTLNAGRADQRVLLDIPRWSFNWQLIYQPADEVELQAGDTVTVECSWDRSLRSNDPPRYITWAEGTQDEMCMGIIATADHVAR